MVQIYCSSCGNPIPEGQGKSCSMCYGDVNYGRDRYYEDWLLERMADEDNRRMEQEAEQEPESN